MSKLVSIRFLRHILPPSLMIFFMTWVLPREAERLATETQTSVSPDTSFFYTADTLYAMAEAYGTAGRQAYIISRVRFDVFWPLIYGLFFWHILYITGVKHQKILLLPWLAVLLDLLENTLVSIVFYRFPMQTTGLAHIAGFITASKWLVIGVTAISSVIAILSIVYRRKFRAST